MHHASSLASTPEAGERADEPAPAERTSTRRLARMTGSGRPNSLARRFMLASLAVLVVGGLVIGVWVGGSLERGIIDRTASITALYVESFVEPHLGGLAEGEWLDGSDVEDLDELLADTTFGERIVALKVWRPDGAILYSPDRTLIGEQFPVEGGLADAVAGNVVAEMSELEADENVGEQARGFDRLLEMYLPVRERGTGRIIAVAEFYELPNDIERQVSDARLQSWLVVAAGVSVVYLLLFGIVRQGSQTIDRQRLALEQQVTELSTLLDQNEQLRQRVRVAAERTTTLSERNLRRISSDLHDGPGQMLALAMMRVDQFRNGGDHVASDAELDELNGVLGDALGDMRSIAAGLRLPELGSLSVADIARRAVDDHVRRSTVRASLSVADGLPTISLPTKIALFRALQELLSNSTRHGGGAEVEVQLRVDGSDLRLDVTDGGPGFAGVGAGIGEGGHLGLAGIREQAELLSGRFEVGERDGGGARVTVRWPL